MVFDSVTTTTDKSFSIFCDGACSGNPGPGGWGAIVVDPQNEVTELGGAEPHTTNNQMEMMAAIEALAFITPAEASVTIYTDSVYVINGITKWIFGWQQRDWKTSTGEKVANQALWEKLLAQTTRFKKRLSWKYVPGHRGVVGNERADAIAVGFATQIPIALYRGSLNEYSHRVLPVEVPASSSGKKKGGATKGYYLSYVDKVLEKHLTWADCEARVKGKTGALFKKISSPQEEADTLKQWGLHV